MEVAWGSHGGHVGVVWRITWAWTWGAAWGPRWGSRVPSATIAWSAALSKKSSSEPSRSSVTWVSRGCLKGRVHTRVRVVTAAEVSPRAYLRSWGPLSATWSPHGRHVGVSHGRVT
eukprot:5356486-Prymnesium_polylepis.1